jgi:sulfhydrogenase subunit beta (sulfur reductase)
MTGYIPKEAWTTFVESLTRRFEVYAPCKEGDTVAFERLGAGKAMCLDRPAHSAPKAVIFPQSETLFSFTLKKDADQPRKPEVELRDDRATPDTLILCGRPCDARGFATFDPVYLAKDPYYRGRRESTTIMTLACPSGFAGCFCTSVDGGPADKKDSDVLITEVAQGYYVETLTDKGQAALKDSGIEDGTHYREEAEARQTDAERHIKKAFEGGKDLRISSETFQSDEFWEEVSAKCISCGACTYLCPTCYCFNITDEQGIDTGERIRSWDSCMFPHYTLEASGHNPRTRKAQRLKNRIGHKFVYYPELHHELLCSGCGRCIRHCPVSVEISRIVAKMTHAEEGAGEGANP